MKNDLTIEVNLKLIKGICFIKTAKRTYCLKYVDNNIKLLNKNPLEKIISKLLYEVQFESLISKEVSKKIHSTVIKNNNVIDNINYESTFTIHIPQEDNDIPDNCNNLTAWDRLSILAKGIYDDYLANLDFFYDDVYIIHSNSGEATIFLAYLAKAYIEKNKSKAPLFIATKKYHIDLIKLFFPNAKYVYYDIYFKDDRVRKIGSMWSIYGHRFYMIFAPEHFNKVNYEIGRIHYVKAMLDTLELSKKDIEEPEILIDYKIKMQVENKLKELGLNLDNFVILAPEAMTYSELSPSFWQNIADTLKDMGYDLFVNSTSNKYNITGCISEFLTYTEIFYLATRAKAIISLRSGLTEFLLLSNCPLSITICTQIPWSPMPIEKCIDAYSIMGIPFIKKKNAKELNFNKFKSEPATAKYITTLFKKL